MLLGTLLGAAIVVMWIAALIHIVRHRGSRSTGSTVLWVVVVLILPIVGSLAYFLANALNTAMEGDEIVGSPAEQSHGSEFGDDLSTASTRDPDGARYGR